MVDTALIWVGLLVASVAVLGALAAWRFAARGDRPLLSLAGAALALAGVFEIGEAGGYFWTQAATVLGGLSLLLALGLAGQWYRER